jgi:hypothetical protein
MGLEHNEWVDPGTGHHMLMYSCSACTSSQQTPQSMDITLINTMYPPNTAAPSLYTYCGYDWNYQYDNHGPYSTSGAYTSQAGLNTWYTTSRGNGNGTLCHEATWSISNSTHRCVNLLFWDSWYNTNVTTLVFTITSYLRGQGTWYDYVNVNESPTWNYINLGNFPYAYEVSVYDNQAGTGSNGATGGATFAVGPIKLQWC